MCPRSVLSRRHPFAPPALPGFIATMGASDFPTPPVPFSRFALVRNCAFTSRAGVGISTVTAHSPFKLDWACDPGWARRARPLARHAVACWRPEAIGPLPLWPFRDFDLHGSTRPPFHLACFRAYASSAPSPVHLQGSITGLWLTVTRAGLSPARMCGIAMPQPGPGQQSTGTSCFPQHACCGRLSYFDSPPPYPSCKRGRRGFLPRLTGAARSAGSPPESKAPVPSGGSPAAGPGGRGGSRP